MLARIRAILRRKGSEPQDGDGARRFHFSGWTLDVGLRQVLSPEGARIAITGAEFDLLHAKAVNFAHGDTLMIGAVLAVMGIDAGEGKDFDAPAWLSRWLREPLPALGGALPEAGRICPLSGRGLRARVLRAGRLVRAGMLSPAEAAAVAAEAENVAMAFAPLPVPPLDD